MQSRESLLDSRPLVLVIATAEVVLGSAMVAGLWPRATRWVTICLFAVFAGVAGTAAFHHEQSCGCFGVVQTRPIYTAAFDGVAVGLLALLPARATTAQKAALTRRGTVASVLSLLMFALIGTIEVQAKPMRESVISSSATNMATPDFGSPGSQVELDPPAWVGKPFALAGHIDVGTDLLHGRWIVLLVHNGCEHCDAAVPDYVSESTTGHGAPVTRLAVIEMPPYAEPGDPPPWEPLPDSVVTGQLDESRDWLAATPIVVLLRDGIVIKTAEGDVAGDPAAWF